MKVHKTLAVLLLMILLISCSPKENQVVGETAETEQAQETEEVTKETLPEPVVETKEPEEEKPLSESVWEKGDPIALDEYVKEGQAFHLFSSIAHDDQVLLMVYETVSQSGAFPKRVAKEILSYSLKDNKMNPIHQFDQEITVISAVLAKEGLYTLEVKPSQQREGLRADIMLYGNDGEKRHCDDIEMDDVKALPLLYKTEQRVVYPRVSYSIEDGKIIGLEGDVSFLVNGWKKPFYQSTVREISSVEDALKRMIQLAPRCSIFGNELTFLVRNGDKSILHILREGKDVERVELDRLVYKADLFKGRVLCTYLDKATNTSKLFSYNLADKKFTEHLNEEVDPGIATFPYDDHSRVYYEEAPNTTKGVKDRAVGRIKRIWIDEVGMLHRETLLETEDFHLGEIEQSMILAGKDLILTFVKKTPLQEENEENQEAGSDVHWSLVPYRKVK